jgi:5-formyltetrahydrofolate cyclo-ligase
LFIYQLRGQKPNANIIDSYYYRCFDLPILVGKSLKFAKIGNEFKKNKFGIDEPVATEVLNAKQLDVIFIPVVGFDKNKNRISLFWRINKHFFAFLVNRGNLKEHHAHYII